MAKAKKSPFAQLKANRNTSLEQIQKKLEQENTKSTYTDDRFWSASLDKSGNAFAVIRFLPAVDGETAPWIKRYSHGFKVNGWYIENCPTTLEKDCPACKSNNALWNSGIESDKDIVRKFRKRKLSYISNIQVIKDPKNPENEGKHFLFRYGSKIWDKIDNKMSPQYEGEVAYNPFDFWEGADFKLKIKKVKGYSNYDDSEFANQTELFAGDDDKKEVLWKTQHALMQFIDVTEFKTFDKLKERLDRVLGQSSDVSKTAEIETSYTSTSTIEDEADEVFGGGDGAVEETVTAEESESESMDYFNSLAE